MSRDQVVAAIYETVIQPELYDAFMEAWDAHIQAALREPGAHHGLADGQDALNLDPQLQAHFFRAYEILEQIGRKTSQGSLTDQVRQSPGFSVVAQGDGKILAAGAAALAVLQDGPLPTALAGHLTAGSAALLQDMLKSVREKVGSDPSVVLTTGGHPRHLIARIARTADDSGQITALLVIDALDYQWSVRAGQMLVTSFSLSRAEVEIVRNLLAGHNLREIAEMSGRSEHTVRNQAKAVLAKTGAPGQVDLIRLVAFLINTDSQNNPRQPGLADLPQEIMNMSSGLDMQLFRAGPETGRPVIFLHGMLDGMSPLHFAAKDLHRRGLRVLAPVRPGYGLSEPVSNPADALGVFTDHVRELINREKLDRPVILGYLAGSVYGYSLCSQLGDKLAGQVAVGGSAPVVRLSQLSNMPPRQRLVAYTARYAPALLPFVLRAGIAQIDGKDINGFIEALFPPGSHDFGVIEGNGLINLFRTGYRFSVQQGHLGFATDSYHVVRDWSTEITQPSAPIIHLQGGHDPVVPESSVRAFIETQKNVQLRVLSEAGQQLFYERPDVVFAAIEELGRINGSRP